MAGCHHVAKFLHHKWRPLSGVCRRRTITYTWGRAEESMLGTGVNRVNFWLLFNAVPTLRRSPRDLPVEQPGALLTVLFRDQAGYGSIVLAVLIPTLSLRPSPLKTWNGGIVRETRTIRECKKLTGLKVWTQLIAWRFHLSSWVRHFIVLRLQLPLRCSSEPFVTCDKKDV